MSDHHEFDVAVIGGAIAGAAAATLLLRKHPTLRVLIVERSDAFGKRVGESTVELSSYFLTRVLGLSRHLYEKQLIKQGFRYWFTNRHTTCLGDCTEMGGKYLSRVGSFQVDRSTLDQEVLDRVVAMGATLWRPASVRQVELHDGGMQQLLVKMTPEKDPAGPGGEGGGGATPQAQTRHVRCRWVIDGSGRQAIVARHRGEVQPLAEHPTHSVWARFRNTLDFDGHNLTTAYPQLRKGFHGNRHTATNHIMGDGWWAWIIPLRDGETSVGVVWDSRLFNWPRDAGKTLGEQLRAVISSNPTGREVLQGAELVEDDTHIRRNLPYLCETTAGNGYLLVGDAAGFLDPFYSMGLDAMSINVSSGIDLVIAHYDNTPREALEQKIAAHNRVIWRTYTRWFEAVYRDKYVYMGDFEFMRIAFLSDVGLYYLGIVMPPYKRGPMTIKDGMFDNRPATVVYWYMRWVNRRLAAMAWSRRRRGTFGRKNAGHRLLVPGFAFNARIPRALASAVTSHLRLELTEGWRTWRTPRVQIKNDPQPIAASPAPTPEAM